MHIEKHIVLILNCNWHPVGFCNVFHAITKVCSERARFLDTENFQLMGIEDWFEYDRYSKTISTTRGAFPVPEIIVACHYAKIPTFKPYPTKKNILKRDNYVCQYTGKKLSSKEATIDHVFPKSRGGPLSWENCVAASFEVNNMKRNRTPEEFGINLSMRPSMPKWTIFHTLPSNFSMPDSWKNFIKE